MQFAHIYDIIIIMINQIFESLITIIDFFNDPEQDIVLLKRVGNLNDKNLLPIVVRVGRQPEISVGELARQLGKNHSSISRQVSKLEKKGIISSLTHSEDKRIRMLTLASEGEVIYNNITEVRYQLLTELFSHLKEEEVVSIANSLDTLKKVLPRKNS